MMNGKSVIYERKGDLNQEGVQIRRDVPYSHVPGCARLQILSKSRDSTVKSVCDECPIRHQCGFAEVWW